METISLSLGYEKILFYNRHDLKKTTTIRKKLQIEEMQFWLCNQWKTLEYYLKSKNNNTVYLYYSFQRHKVTHHSIMER